MEQRRYETLVLLSPDLSSEELDQIKTKFTDIIDRLQGRLIRLDDWGRRQLAYQVKKQLYGYYYLMDFMGTPSLLTELERQMRLDERVFKFLTLLLDKNFSAEKCQAEIDRLQAEKDKREAQEQERLAAEARIREEAEAAKKAESSEEAEVSTSTDASEEVEAVTETETPEETASLAQDATPEPADRPEPEPETQSAPEVQEDPGQKASDS